MHSANISIWMLILFFLMCEMPNLARFQMENGIVVWLKGFRWQEKMASHSLSPFRFIPQNNFMLHIGLMPFENMKIKQESVLFGIVILHLKYWLPLILEPVSTRIFIPFLQFSVILLREDCRQSVALSLKKNWIVFSIIVREKSVMGLYITLRQILIISLIMRTYFARHLYV